MTRPVKIPAQAGFEPEIFRSRGGRLNHYTNEAVGTAGQFILGRGCRKTCSKQVCVFLSFLRQEDDQLQETRCLIKSYGYTDQAFTPFCANNEQVRTLCVDC